MNAYADFNSALIQRNAANRVRYTASLVVGHDHIREKQAERWAADINSNTIMWRLSAPWDHSKLIPDELFRWLIIHEASHIELTGSWDMPDKTEIDNEKNFFRFWNGMEDIRIELWAKSKFPGAAQDCRTTHAFFDKMLEQVQDDLALPDQVMFAFIAKANDLPVVAKGEAKILAEKYWPEMDYITSTSLSSAEVARRILPIYQALLKKSDGKRDDNKEAPDLTGMLIGGAAEGNGGDGDGKGSQQPQDDPKDPHTSSDKDANPGTVLGLRELLEGLSEAAKGEGKRQLIVMVAQEKRAEQEASQQASQGAGTDASGINSRSEDWNRTRELMRDEINLLSRKLETTLEQNASFAHETRLKRGQFDGKRAHRSLHGDMRIFRKKTAIGRVDYDFCITVDLSSSQGGRQKELTESCVIASEAIEKCGMGLALITWDGGMRHYKTFYTPLNQVKAAIGYDLMHPAGGTVEPYALRVAEEMLMQRVRMGRQAFLITLTDGITSRMNESVAIMRDMESNGIHTIGIGVTCPAPKHYQTKLRVDKTKDLPFVLPNLLRDLVKKS